MTNIKPILDENLNGTSFVSLTTITIPKLRGGKKNPFRGRVKKIAKSTSAMIFQNKQKNGYKAMVTRRLGKEMKDANDFKLKPRTWGERIPNAPIVHHKGNYFLEVVFLKPSNVHYEVDGVKTNPEDIEGLEINHSEGTQGGLEDKVVIRTFKLDNIIKFKIGGNTYTDLEYFK